MKLSQHFVLPVILVTSLFTANAFAQSATLKSEWQHAVTRRLNHTQAADAAQMIARANSATDAYLKSENVAFQMIRLENSEFDSFLFLPQTSGHLLNRVAAQVGAKYSGLRLIYSPGHLMRGIEGFFSERDLVLGLSHTMVDRGGGVDPTFYHELVHVNHFYQRMKNKLHPLNAAFIVTEKNIQAQLSKVGSDYRRIQSLEEIEAHVYSLKYLANEVRALKALPGTLNSIERLLTVMYYNAGNGYDISRQTVDLVSKTLASPSWAQTQGSMQKLGNRSVWVRELVFEAYPSFTDGAKATFKYAKPVQDDRLKASLVRASEIAQVVGPEYKRVMDSIYWMIERADAARTDLNKVFQAVESLESSLNGAVLKSF